MKTLKISINDNEVKTLAVNDKEVDTILKIIEIFNVS